jgi:hypothetical protein
MKEVSQMVRDYVFRTALKKAPKERIEEMLKTVGCHKSVEVFRFGPEFGIHDLMDLVDAAGIDIGITIRLRDGEEVTFYPGHNFGKTGGQNGTPREKLVAKKPYEYENYANNYQANPGRNGVHTPAQTGSRAWLAGRGRGGGMAGCAGLYAQDDDDDFVDAFGQQIGPKPASASRSSSKFPTEPLRDVPAKPPEDEKPTTLCDVKKPEVVDLRVIDGDQDGRGEN